MDGIVEKLLGVFRSLKGRGGDGKKRRGMVFAGIGAAVAMLIIGLLSFKAWKTGKKMAKLLHEKAVTEEKAEQAKADEKIADSEEKKQAAAEKVSEIQKKIVEVDEAIEEAKTTYEQAKETIHEIQTWDEFDKLTRG